jgi:hypothetical protein
LCVVSVSPYLYVNSCVFLFADGFGYRGPVLFEMEQLPLQYDVSDKPATG